MQWFSHNEDADIEQPPGTCMVISSEDWKKLGGFDEELSLYYNDVDICQRARETGKRIRFVSSASIYHYEGASTAKSKRLSIGNPLFFINQQQYYKKAFGLSGYLVCLCNIVLITIEIFFRILLNRKSLSDKTIAVKQLVKDFLTVTKKQHATSYDQKT
jgi:GT2 family glycosyltransferase